MASNGGSDFKWASSQEERNKLWTARHNYFYAVTSRHPNKRVRHWENVRQMHA